MRSRALLTTVAVAAAALVVFPFAGPGQAKERPARDPRVQVWASGNHEWFKVDRVCRDGMIIDLASELFDEGPDMYYMDLFVVDAGDPNLPLIHEVSDVPVPPRNGRPIPTMTKAQAEKIVAVRFDYRVRWNLPSPPPKTISVNPGSDDEPHPVRNCSIG
jgi:hypothetical protein